jgi:hypothetical protein
MAYIPAKRRAKSATVVTGKGKNTRHKFPVDSKKTADSAMKLLNNAKPPLTRSQRSAVIREAHKYDPDAKPAGSAKKQSSSSQKVTGKK